MKIGDIVRLKYSFKPESDGLREYTYGIVIGLVQHESDNSETEERSQPDEVIVQLYDPETLTTYTDELGTQPMFYFRIDELYDEPEL